MKIRVIIADTPINIEIEPHQEEIIRRAAKKINEGMTKSHRKFKSTALEHLAMTALMISIENEQNKEKYHYSIDRLELEALANSVDSVLKK